MWARSPSPPKGHPTITRRTQPPTFALQVHNVTKQVEYRGEMVDLTESLSHLPAGGQVVLSDTTFSQTAGCLHRIRLPAFTFQTARNSLEGPKSRRGSMEGLRSMYSKQLVTVSVKAMCVVIMDSGMALYTLYIYILYPMYCTLYALYTAHYMLCTLYTFVGLCACSV